MAVLKRPQSTSNAIFVSMSRLLPSHHLPHEEPICHKTSGASAEAHSMLFPALSRALKGNGLDSAALWFNFCCRNN